ncbi:CRISPR-associated protein Csx19 [Rhodococcus sp. 14-2483-1-2]|uniref:type III-D CRISPR-associated protein Csx19 n=1 Tax=Rhodococcus sp. 14-2483-1-2 TaxID=2023147 RepID=UPI000B9A4EF6|nr:CRISPR-associated protein Csx19 [Rhodococcus sp. 14-2483-1-2]OZF37302.1 hypothetical protein CH295_06430 [Rhodococcus sp. 14-2483-1-2]
MTTNIVDYSIELACTTSIEAITATAALERFANDEAAGVVGFVYTPNDAPWFRMTPDGARLRDESAIPDDAFELRAFTPEQELRWWRTSGFDQGKAVILSEAPVVDETSATGAAGPHPLRQGDARSLLLWGTATFAYEDGWAQFTDRRVGDLWLPLETQPPTHSRARLAVVDYATRDEHGNVAVVDQRLLRIQVEEQ